MLYTLRFFSLQNAVCFIMLTCLVPVLFTFYIQVVLKLKKIIPAPKGLLDVVCVPYVLRTEALHIIQVNMFQGFILLYNGLYTYFVMSYVRIRPS